MSVSENRINIFLKTLYDYLEDLFNRHDHNFKSFEVVNLNDDYVVYFIVYIVTIICLFALNVLTNFYTKKDIDDTD